MDSWHEKIRKSLAVKLVVIGALLLLLQIPTAMIYFLISARNDGQAGAVREIGAKWGGAQTLTGPFLVTLPEANGNHGAKAPRSMVLPPDQLEVKCDLKPELRYRGIYQTVLYRGDFELRGRFVIPGDLDGVDGVHAELGVGVGDLKGIVGEKMEINGRSVACSPGVPRGVPGANGFRCKLPQVLRKGEVIEFKLTLALNGSGGVSFAPVGRNNHVEMTSAWHSPSFTGEFLPQERSVSPGGFRAVWQISEMNRNYPQYWMAEGFRIDSGRFGADFFIPVNLYRQTTRAVHYSVLFIIFTFLAFLFAEVMTREWVHPLQYLMVGLALVLFYVLLLSLGEHLCFGTAYLIATAATVALLGGYTLLIFRKAAVALAVAAVTAAAYALLYFMLRMEDYALLTGSGALFLLLACVMAITGKMNRRT